MEDTSQEMTELMHKMMQEKSPIKRLKMGFSMNETSRYLVTRFILENHPGISELELKKELFLRYYDSDFSSLQKQAFFTYLAERYSSAKR